MKEKKELEILTEAELAEVNGGGYLWDKVRAVVRELTGGGRQQSSTWGGIRG